MLTRAEMKREALASLKGNWGSAIGATLVILLISSAVQFIPIVGPIISLFITGILTFGSCALFMGLVRNEKANFDNIFDGFRGNIGKSFAAYFLTILFTTLWTLLFIIPGMIAAIKYSQTFFILNDNPDMTATQAINKSKDMMQGNKMDFFILQLSFLGWIILAGLTFGIGFIWLLPYINVTMVKFYEGVKHQYETTTTTS